MVSQWKQFLYKVLYSTPYRIIRSLSHIGNQRMCPCCGWRLRQFLPVDGRPDAICPRCRSMERHRLLWLYLVRNTDIQSEPLRLLHIAPEYSLLRRFYTMKNLTYLTADLGSEGYHYTKIDMMMDVTFSAFASGSVDAIICNHVLEHVPDDRRAIRECYRVLRPGGWAFLNVPIYMDRPTYEDATITDPAERKKHFGQHDHVRICGYDYGERYTEAGFAIETVRASDLSPNERQKCAIPQREILFFCHKPE